MAHGLNVAIAWFRAEDYERVRQISGDGMPPRFEEWEAKMAEMLARSSAAGILGEKVIICSDELLAFARQIHVGKIDNQVRSRLATLKLLEARRSANPLAASQPSRSKHVADGDAPQMSPHRIVDGDGGSDMDRD